MADEDKKSKTAADKAEIDEAKGNAPEGDEKGSSKKRSGISPLLLIVSGVVSMAVFVGIFSYMMGVFDPPPAETAEESADAATVEDTLPTPPGVWHTEFGRAAAVASAVQDSGVIDTVQELSILDRRQREIAADEAHLDKERQELTRLKQEVEVLLANKNAVATEKVIYMAKLLDAMKPEEITGLITELDDKTILKVLPRMKPKNASKVLALLPPKRAAQIATTLLESDL